MQLKKISRTVEHTLKTIIYEENVRFKTIITEKITKPRAISQEKNVSWVTRRAVIKLMYFSGFATAIYRSSAKPHRLIAGAYAKSHLIKSTQDAWGWGHGQLQPPLMSQKNSEGTANAPTQKSATASETMSALVLVRSRRRMPTRSTMKPFPAIVKMDRIQPRIQNQISILYSVQSFSWAFKFMSLKETGRVILYTSGNVCAGVCALHVTNMIYLIRQFLITKLTVGQQKHSDQLQGSVFNFVLHI